jgi:hypothetical protein
VKSEMITSSMTTSKYLTFSPPGAMKCNRHLLDMLTSTTRPKEFGASSVQFFGNLKITETSSARRSPASAAGSDSGRLRVSEVIPGYLYPLSVVAVFRLASNTINLHICIERHVHASVSHEWKTAPYPVARRSSSRCTGRRGTSKGGTSLTIQYRQLELLLDVTKLKLR